MNTLTKIKVLHTVIWAFFAACIFAIPVLTALSQLKTALFFAAIVLLEVAVLILNRMSCPLTDIAAQYTNDRRANFDIYLPEWLARHNKIIFGVLYFAALAYLIVAWRSFR